MELDYKEQHNCMGQQTLKNRIAQTEEKVLAFIARENLIAPGNRIVVGVSGGADSMALLHFLFTHRHLWQITVAGAHLDHCLRGEVSAAERQGVIEFCRVQKIPLLSQAVDVKQWGETEGEHNIEAAARQVRYDFLRQAAKLMGGAVIATAHHLDDQGETILMHLLRGSGMQGLGGMAPRNNNVIRPLLSLTKAEILDYCAYYALPYCTDQSNFDLSYLRNKIRLQLLPALRHYNPNIGEVLGNLGEICREENQYLAAEAEKGLWALSPVIEKDQAAFDGEGFLALPVALQRRVLQSFFRLFQAEGHILEESQGLSFAQVERWRGLEPGKQLTLPGGVIGKRTQNQFLLLRPRQQGRIQERKQAFCYQLAEITCRQRLAFGGKQKQHVWVTPVRSVSFPEDCLTIADPHTLFVPQKLGAGMALRTRLPGDIFSPYGMDGCMKLKKYFINEKITMELRDGLPLLAKNGQILWVIGKRYGNMIDQRGNNRIRKKEAKAWASIDGWLIEVLK